MNLLQWYRKVFIALTLVLVLTLAMACSGLNQAAQATTLSVIGSRVVYEQLERGNTAATSQDFGEWVVQTAKGLIQEASVRDDELNVVLASQARPNEVQPLIKSLVQSFQRSSPNRNLTVLMYSPNKQLILTARVDNGTVKLTLH